MDQLRCENCIHNLLLLLREPAVSEAYQPTPPTHPHNYTQCGSECLSSVRGGGGGGGLWFGGQVKRG